MSEINKNHQIWYGGIGIKRNDKSRHVLVTEFLENSKIEEFTVGSKGGIILSAKLNNGIESPFYVYRSNYPDKQIREVLLKVIFFSDKGIEFMSRNRRLKLSGCKVKDFLHEVNTQKEIFEKSFDYSLEPICPDIVDAFRAKLEFVKCLKNIPILNKIKTEYTKQYNQLADSLECGLIIMEKMEHVSKIKFEYVSSVTDDIEKNSDFYFAAFELIKLYRLGYYHGDPHLENILIQRDYNYFEFIKGRGHLIDFGKTVLVKDADNHPPDLSLSPVKQLQNQLDYLKNKVTIDPITKSKIRGDEWFSYQWIRHFIQRNNENALNLVFEKMFRKREEAKETFVREFENNVNKDEKIDTQERSEKSQTTTTTTTTTNETKNSSSSNDSSSSISSLISSNSSSISSKNSVMYQTAPSHEDVIEKDKKGGNDSTLFHVISTSTASVTPNELNKENKLNKNNGPNDTKGEVFWKQFSSKFEKKFVDKYIDETKMFLNNLVKELSVKKNYGGYNRKFESNKRANKRIKKTKTKTKTKNKKKTKTKKKPMCL